MARSLQFNASWLYRESAAVTDVAEKAAPVAASAPAAVAVAGAARPAVVTPVESSAVEQAEQAEQAVVTELLQIARTVLTLEITFEAGSHGPAVAPASDGVARRTPVVLRDGQVYGTLRCVSDERRTPVGSRPADALRCVAVLVGKELDRHRRGRPDRQASV